MINTLDLVKREIRENLVYAGHNGGAAGDLVEIAGCAYPDNNTSAGSVYLVAVLDATFESISDLDSLRDESLDADNAHEIADGIVPIYTHDVWDTFVDLAAYREDVSELAGDSGSVDMESLAKIALYMIAERTALVLIESLRNAIANVDECDVIA